MYKYNTWTGALGELSLQEKKSLHLANVLTYRNVKWEDPCARPISELYVSHYEGDLCLRETHHCLS